MLFKSVLLLALFLSSAADQRDISLKVQRAVMPIPPVHMWTPGLVVTEIAVNQSTGAVQTRTLHGESPFLFSAEDALMRWRFSPPPAIVHSRTSITFLFRPSVLYSVDMGDAAIRPWMPGEDSPALPQKVIDPGYTPGAQSAGAVILEVSVSAQGAVTAIETVNGIDDLTEQAKAAVSRWKFSPAILSGKAVPSTAYVVISFVL
jgi:TonB family protein